jgi:Xaa-Pro aminopeptidase
MYIDTLRRMTPEQRLAKALELSEMTREALRAGLRERYPSATASELHELYLERLAKCRRRNS